ncbi:MAG: hypothetical protein HY961_13275 [Ignavibacteriae bacterium]|nr:hypothetical protein [Ignavibacteriota bacterium]
MAKIFVPGYKNIIQSFVLVGAGLLIIAVGLRTLTTLPLEAVYAALGLEYTLLLMWAVTVYYTDDSEMQTASATGAAEARSATTEVLIHSMEQLTFSVALLENRLRTTEGRFDKFSKLDSSLENLASELELLTTEQIGVRVRQEFERMIAEVSTRVLNKNGDGEATLSRLKGGSSLGRASASSW